MEKARKPVKIGGLRAPTPVPDDFNTMFDAEIEALFAGALAVTPPRKRK